MRPVMIFTVAVALVIGLEGRSQSQDEARAIVSKAIKAMGADKDPENAKGVQAKLKGTLEVMGMTLNLSQTVLIRLPNQFKESVELEVNGMKIPIVTVFDGKKGWVEVNGMIMKLDDKINDELREVSNLLKINRLKPLLGNDYQLALIGEAKVEDKAAVGVRVTSKGAKDISLYF